MTAPPGAAEGADPRRWRALAVCLVTGAMTLLDVSIVNVALPSIEESLRASNSQLQWVLSGYTLTFGLTLVPAGRFGDARGRRNAFVAGLALFTAASAAAGLAQSALFLVIVRLVQGIAGGIITPQISGLIQQMFEPKERGRPFGLLGAVIGLSTAVGPLLGGLLIYFAGSHEGWRWVFYVNVPIGIVAAFLAYRLIPSRAVAADGGRESLDPVGVALLGLGVFLVLLPLVQEREWTGRGKWLLEVAALAVLAGFVAWERWYGRRAAPVIDLSLFKLRSYALGTLLALAYFAGFTAIFFIFTLYLQAGLGYSALAAGMAITPFAVGSAGAAAASGRFVNRIGRVLIVVGLALVVVGFTVTILAVEWEPGRGAPWATAAPLLLAGIGSGMVISPNQALTLVQVPVRRGGSAGAVLQTGQRVGAAVGIAAIGSAFFADLARMTGNWAHAFQVGLMVAIGFILLAMLAGVVDTVAGRRAEQRLSAA
jgi:EmrB/QacA subfamily drug resistance transporter